MFAFICLYINKVYYESVCKNVFDNIVVLLARATLNNMTQIEISLIAKPSKGGKIASQYCRFFCQQTLQI